MGAVDAYRRSMAEAAAESSPVLPRPHGNSRFTAAGVTQRNALMQRPSTPKRTDALRTLLYAKTQEQYGRSLVGEAAKYGVTIDGPVTDAPTLVKLANRADFASQKIADTYARQLAGAKQRGGTISALNAARGYKPDQIWDYEMGLAAHNAVMDFHANHPELQATAHVEPQESTTDDLCSDMIDRGSVPVSEIDTEMPNHPNCPHYWESDPPADDPTMVDAGTVTSDGDVVSDPVPMSLLTAALLQAIDWWTAGLAIVQALGDAEGDTSMTDGGD